MTNDRDGNFRPSEDLNVLGDERPIADPPQRVSGMRVPTSWALAGKPAELAPDADDAWRQTGFLLGEDLRLLTAGLDLQTRMAGTGYTARARTMRMAAQASLWSRALLTASDATHLVRTGSYQSAAGLTRQVVELVAAQAGLEADYEAFKRWAHEAYGRHAEARAEEIGLGHYFAGEVIAGDEDLRRIYRGASDLARPNFGPTALFTAAEATHQRYPLIFADHAFHLGWAQLLLGWLLRLDAKQLHLALHASMLFPAAEELRAEAVEHVRRVEAHLADDRRCRLDEWTDEEGRRRHLLVEFRRQSSDAPTRLLL
ncbi:MAG: hypothetical protein R3C39_01465 [Dehalococcoidia bacterium]